MLSFHQVSLSKSCTHSLPFSPMRATCLAHFIPLALLCTVQTMQLLILLCTVQTMQLLTLLCTVQRPCSSSLSCVQFRPCSSSLSCHLLLLSRQHSNTCSIYVSHRTCACFEPEELSLPFCKRGYFYCAYNGRQMK